MSVRSLYRLLGAALGLGLCVHVASAQTPVTWTQGVTGNWNATANWSGLIPPDLLPNNGANTYTVTIPGVNGQANTTTVIFDNTTIVGNTITISGLALSSALNASGNASAELVLGPGTLLNAGNLANFSGTTLSGGRYFIDGTLRFNGANVQTLAGGTTLIMNGAAAQVLNQANNVGALSGLSNNQGTFDLRNGYNHNAVNGFTNSGIVSVSEGSTFATTGTFTNTGTLLGSGVSGTGTINVTSTTLNNGGGTLSAGNNGVVFINGSTINGGTLTSTGNGYITLSNNGGNRLDNVALNGTMNLATSTGIARVYNGLAMTNGTIALDNSSIVSFEGTQTLGGTGTVTLGASGNNRIAIDGNNSNITIGSGVTIRGQNGSIGAQAFVGSSSTVLTNNGKISADVGGGTITLQQARVDNNGILEAKNGGVLSLATNVNNGASGQMNASNTGVVLMNNSTVNGGTINTLAGGAFTGSNSGGNFLNDATLNGHIDLATATGQIQVAGTTGLTMMSGSTIDINNNSILGFRGNQTLGGTGKVIFGSTGGSNRIAIDNNNAVLTIGANAQIRGENGTIGAQAYVGSSNTSILNNGRISADVLGGTINISQATVTNNGVLEALNGGTLILSTNVAGGAGGQILAGAGSTVLQNSVVLSGTINTSGSGSFRPTNSGNNYLNGVTLNGNLDMASFTAQDRVLNGLTLNGNVNLNQNSVLAFEGSQTLSGNGKIILGNTGASNRIAVDANNSLLTIGAGVQIRGENGTIGNQANIGSSSTSIFNNGRISADVAGGTINIGQATITNNGVLEALNGGQLVLSSNVTGTPSGQILAGAGSVVLQNGVSMSGVINSSGTGVLRATNNGANFFNGVTLNGNLDLAGATGTERVMNGLLLNGTVSINQNSVLAFEGTQTLGGTGAVVLGSTGASNKLSIDGNNTNLTIGSGVLVHGENGTVGAQHFVGSSSTVITNNGRISADVNGGTITLTQALFANNGTLEGANGGTLAITSTSVNQGASGVIKATSNGVAVQNGSTITGGTITTTTGGRFVATNNGNNFLNDVTLNGNMDMATATGTARVNGSTGIAMQAGSVIGINQNSVLAFSGNQTLSGTGDVLFGNTGAGNKIAIDNNNSTLTIGQGVVVHGINGSIGSQHFVGSSSTHLVNNGTINSDGGGVISIIPGSMVDLKNNGTLRAQNGTLNLSHSVTGTGTLQVDAAGILNMANSGSGSVQDKLVMGATGSTLNNANRNITINTDYTNVAAGTGNAFDRRAGINGTGQILAGGNAAQAITGTGVTNGNTVNATLTIGNVRVGTTAFAYQVANTGTTGPDLRGAIQTSVNGGNITDARLSGAGVTSSNYGPVPVATNSGNLGVNFTAATAGLLAPLNGQAVNLRSNFENIADQKLNIALGANAAAYNAAVGSAGTPVNLGNTRVGGSLSGNVTVTNAAPAGAFSEKLDATFGANTGNASNNGGSIGLLAAGSSNNTSMGVSLSTSASGLRTGTVALNYVTNGTGTSGLANAAAGSQAVTVNGNVYQAAAGQLNSTPLSFGTVQVGQNVSKTLSITNSASGAAGFVEDLNAAFGATSGTGSGLISGTGSISGLLAGATNTNAMTVSVNTSSAGVVNGNIAVNYTSAGAVNGTSNGLGTLAVGNSLFGVDGIIQAQANVVNQASPVINNSPINLGNVRINAASPTAFVSVTNAATTPPQAALNATISGNGAITGTGSFNLLNPGATNANSLQVGMNTSSAGSKNGNATLGFVSDASNIGNCAPNCQLTLASQNVAVNGAVYRLANPTIGAAPINLVARVGDAAPTASIGLSNTSADAFTERLDASFNGAAPTGFNTSGSVVGLAAQGSSNALNVGLNTATAGVFGGNASINLTSSGAGTTLAADQALTQGSKALSGKVYTAAVGQVNTNTVNFGTVHVGDVVAAKNVSVTNGATVTALNDVLKGDITGGNAALSVAGNLGTGVSAGNTNNSSLNVNLNTSNAGVFTGTAGVNLKSSNADMADLNLGSTPVSLMGTVNNYASASFIRSAGQGGFNFVNGAWVLDFGSITLGSSNIFATLGVKNTANGPADELNGDFAFGGGSTFGLTGFGPFSMLGAGSTFGNLGVFFNTNVQGLFSQTVTLHSFGSNNSGYQGNLADLQLTITGNVTNIVTPPTTTVPEPSTFVLMFGGLAFVAWARKRRNSR